MTNEKELRQEWEKTYPAQKLQEYGSLFANDEINFWLSKLHSHTKEVVEKIRGMKKENYTNKDIEDQLRIFTVTPVSDVAIKEFARTINNVSSKLGYNSALDDLLASLEDNKK